MTTSPKLKTPPAGMSTDTVTSAVRSPRTFVRVCTGAVAAAFALTACGGGGGNGSAGASTIPVSTAAPASAAAASTVGTEVTTAAKTFTPSTAIPVTVFTPGTPNAPAVGGIVTDIKIQNTAAAQTSVPFTFGQVFAVGDLRPTEGLVAKLANGTVLRLQTDVKATHADGSVRHAVISGVLPALAAAETQTLQLAKSGGPETSTLTPQNLIDAGLTGSVNVKVDNLQYSASLVSALATAAPIKWLSGSVANEWIVSAPLTTSTGIVHPHLTARFDVRWYSGMAKQARVEFVLENSKTFAGGTQNFTYDVNMELGGKSVYSQTGLTHFHHARWRNLAWWDAVRAPQVHLKHNTAYLIASKAVSNYDQSVVPNESSLADYGRQLTAANTGPMKIGPLVSDMGTAGGRSDIGPLPGFSVMYLLSMDKRAKDAMLAAAEGSGTWTIHYRDETTNFPVRTDTGANKRISLHMNLNHEGPLPVPRCANGNWDLCNSPYGADTAHQPSLAYLPYLVTGDYYFLEELHFWTVWNPLGTDPGYSGNGAGLLRWQQLRGQAWSLRTLGHAAYITPDTHSLKAYFTKQLDNNLEYYNDTFVKANPNQLGVYDGSGVASFEVIASAPWQDDFFTWSFGYLTELGFTKAHPILQWKAKYPVGRMTAPGYCWIEGAPYYLTFRENMTKPIYSTFAELYATNFKNDTIKDDNDRPLFHPNGLKFLDQPCGSQAQADWRTAANGWTWLKGQMTGYSDSTVGYPANMQPALAVAAASGIPNAAQAWAVFAGRAKKPDYSFGAMWAIIPR